VPKLRPSNLRVYDSHTAGNSTRLLTTDIPATLGKDMLTRKEYFRKHFDYLRTALTNEPRGYGTAGVAAFLMKPCNPEADFGLIFCDFRGYVDMCTHGTIGVVTTLFEQGLVNKKKFASGFVFDTPSGLVSARPNFAGTRVRSVTVRNVPSFFFKDTLVGLKHYGKVPASIAYGGNTYGYLDVRHLRLPVTKKNAQQLISLGQEILSKLRAQLTSTLPPILGVSLFETLGRYEAKNIMVGDDGLFDRSPCGTGTCGRMAVLHASHKLAKGQEFVNQSILGSKFVGKIIDEIHEGGKSMIIPEITGSAHLTAITDILLSRNDDLKYGFRI